MELRKLINGAALHHNACLSRLLDIAPPQLIHASEQLLRRPASIGSWKTNRGWPAANPSSSGGRQLHLAQLIAGSGGLVIDLVRDRLAEPGDPAIGDRGRSFPRSSAGRWQARRFVRRTRRPRGGVRPAA
jgi:hypothetical protein